MLLGMRHYALHSVRLSLCLSMTTGIAIVDRTESPDGTDSVPFRIAIPVVVEVRLQYPVKLLQLRRHAPLLLPSITSPRLSSFLPCLCENQLLAGIGTIS